MPAYEYRCSDCRYVFEGRRPIAEASLPMDCPTCKNPASRHYGRVNFSFKGGSPTQETADTIIGRAAEKKWAEVNAGIEARRKVREASKEKFVVSADRQNFRASTPQERESIRMAANAYEKRVILEDSK